MMSDPAPDPALDPALDPAFDPAGIRWTPVSPRLATARRLVLLVFCLVLTLTMVATAIGSGQVVFLSGLLAPLLLAGWGWWQIGRQVRSWGYAERADDLLIRRGVVFRELVVVPYGRMQFVDVQAGPLERALDLAKVQLHTASAASDAQIPGLSATEAARLRDALSARGRARLAGL